MTARGENEQSRQLLRDNSLRSRFISRALAAYARIFKDSLVLPAGRGRERVAEATMDAFGQAVQDGRDGKEEKLSHRQWYCP
ncbi:unnamed protein product, partial [Amoebophrya sp. A120]|eukprot:GSA120T00006236001.1